MRTIERNFKKNPHTATLLKNFHTAAYGLPSDIDDDAEALALEAQQDGDLLDMVEDKNVVDLRTENQVRFMNDLIGRLTKLDPSTGETAREYTEMITRKGGWTPGRNGNASAWIGRMIAKEAELKANRPAPATPPAVTDVAPGRYAVEEDGTLKFFHLRYGKAGTRWAGYTFLDIQASSDHYPVKDRVRKARILALIAEDTEMAARRYGIEIGVCGRCGRVLTNEESRAYGMGLICRNN